MPTWMGDNGTWTNPANWSGGVPDAAGVIAYIPTNSNGGTLTIGIPENEEILVGILEIESNGTSGVTIRGSTADSGTGTGTLVFNNDGESAHLRVESIIGGGPVVFSSAFGLNMRLDSHLIVFTETAGTTTRFDLDVSGTGAIIATGDGTLELNGANSFSGGIAASGGIVHAAGDASLGSGAIGVRNYGIFRSSGIINNTISTVLDATGEQGSGTVAAATATTMTLTGSLEHRSQGDFSFGSSTDAGTIVASFTSIINNATESTFSIRGGTLRLGSGYVAANLFERPGFEPMYMSNGAILDTGGFATVISGNLLHGGGATLRSSVGAFNLTVNGTVQYIGSPTTLTIEGTAGVDQLIVNATEFNDDVFITGVSFNNWTGGVDLIQVNGNNVDNSLHGTVQRDTINGYDGDDYLRGGGGIDTINGGNGNDYVELSFNNSGAMVGGGAGIDTLAIQFDTITLGSVSGFERIRVLSGTLQLSGTQFASGFAANSMLSGDGTIIVDLVPGAQPLIFKLMTEEAGSDVKFTINGTSGADIIKANDFTINTINGGAGSDLLNGGNSGDIINGGNDADKIRGGGGVDVMTGGAGADVFKYRSFADAGTGFSSDIINDFVSGTDKLNFRRLDADPGTAGHQSFAFIGSAAFAANGSAQIRYVDTGNDLRVDVDANGDGIADMSIALIGAGAGAGLLFASDFVL